MRDSSKSQVNSVGRERSVGPTSPQMQKLTFDLPAWEKMSPTPTQPHAERPDIEVAVTFFCDGLEHEGITRDGNGGGDQGAVPLGAHEHRN